MSPGGLPESQKQALQVGCEQVKEQVVGTKPATMKKGLILELSSCVEVKEGISDQFCIVVWRVFSLDFNCCMYNIVTIYICVFHALEPVNIEYEITFRTALRQV